MKFSAPARAPEGHIAGLTSYARRARVRPVQIVVNIAEALLGLLGVVVVILALRYGSFAGAGAALDSALACVGHAVAGFWPGNH
ncbi:MAG TPA: hypothetical protein VF402_06045 [Asticcacaulis sp.]